MANVFPAEQRLEVLAALVNGTSIRATERMTGVHRDTIGRFAQAIGEGCARLHDRLVRDLTCSLVDLDEMHGWCKVHQQKFDPAKHDAANAGEQWTWAAICRVSKLVIAWHVGKRDQASAVTLASVRREMPCANPWAVVGEPAVDGEAAMVVSDLARLLRGFPRYLRPVVALAADGHGVVDIAHMLGIPVGTASNRLRRVRDLLAERVDLWRRS
jgi:transposase